MSDFERAAAFEHAADRVLNCVGNAGDRLKLRSNRPLDLLLLRLLQLLRLRGRLPRELRALRAEGGRLRHDGRESKIFEC